MLIVQHLNLTLKRLPITVASKAAQMRTFMDTHEHVSKFYCTVKNV